MIIALAIDPPSTMKHCLWRYRVSDSIKPESNPLPARRQGVNAPTLLITPQRPRFDPEKALNLIQKEAEWVGLRWVTETNQRRSARNGQPENNGAHFSCGVMIEALIDGHIAYAGTSDLSDQGVLRAAQNAALKAKEMTATKVYAASLKERPTSVGHYEGPKGRWLDSETLAAFSEHLIECTRRKVSEAIVTAVAEVSLIESEVWYLTSSGTNIQQRQFMTGQHFGAIAQGLGDTQQRSLNGPTARCQQGGLEAFDWDQLEAACESVGAQALALLKADNCPTETLDLILAADQMLLQIHESIGHPLELDRILGDERNYAGWSFVRPSDFGSLQYGSPLMNVTFDPAYPGEFASYRFDDGGAPATREFLIKEGLLVRGLGGLESQQRLGVQGVSNFRSSSWNRAPIDRMANINLEPGPTPLNDMIQHVERGILMEANRSWSIDDVRNKFQFGCEIGHLIEQGRITKILKNPNYRGVTVPFWRALDAVGDVTTRGHFGTPYCGKGEPHQMIRVGHASPACLFRDIEVFGGDS